MSDGDDAHTYPSAGGAKCGVDETDGLGSRTDALNGHTGVLSVANDAGTAVKATKDVEMRQTKLRTQNSPIEAAR